MTYRHIPAADLKNSGIQKAFDAAVHNLTGINTIACDFDVYNATGFLNGDVPMMIRAGGSYQTPWTRDAAINSWAAGRFLEPDVARNTLFAVCVKDENGDPIIQPDDQRWDRVVWIVGAWQYYLATGDREFLEITRGIAYRGLKRLDQEWFSEEVGLYRGGSFFNDGISGYPADIYEPNMDHSFMGAHPATETIMCLSTNCIYCEAWRILDRMNGLLGISDEEPSRRHLALKETILATFWNADTSATATAEWMPLRSWQASASVFCLVFCLVRPWMTSCRRNTEFPLSCLPLPVCSPKSVPAATTIWYGPSSTVSLSRLRLWQGRQMRLSVS